MKNFIILIIFQLITLVSLTALIFCVLHCFFQIIPQISINKDVSNCFAKIKTVATLDSSFRNALDSVARTSRIDSIIRLLMTKVDENCSQDEKDMVINYFDQHQKAVELTETVLKNLTNEEKDHLNIWNNLNDTASEARLFLSKFQSLSNKNQAILRKSLNEVLNTFVASSLSPNLSKAIGIFNKTDVEQLQVSCWIIRN